MKRNRVLLVDLEVVDAGDVHVEGAGVGLVGFLGPTGRDGGGVALTGLEGVVRGVGIGARRRQGLLAQDGLAGGECSLGPGENENAEKPNPGLCALRMGRRG